MHGVVRCVLGGALQVEDVRDLVIAQNGAVDSMRGADYKVWDDLHGGASEPRCDGDYGAGQALATSTRTFEEVPSS